MIHIIFWLSFGALVGWVAAILHADVHDAKQSFVYMLAGMVGGLTGGLGSMLVGPDDIEYTMLASSLTFAVFGAIAFVTLARFADSKHSS